MESTNIIFGIHAVMEALLSQTQIEKVLLKNGIENAATEKLLALCREKQVPVQYVPVEKLNRLTAGRHQGTVAFTAQIAYIPLEEAVEAACAKDRHPLVLLLDGVTDVRNFGAMARTAECAGVSIIILPAKGGATPNADAIKTSAGALLRIPICRVPNLRMAIYYLKEYGFSIVAATEQGSASITNTDMRNATAIVLGAEDVGISSSVLALCDHKAFIPMRGSIASLNVSAAAAVVLFEAVRQQIDHL